MKHFFIPTLNKKKFVFLFSVAGCVFSLFLMGGENKEWPEIGLDAALRTAWERSPFLIQPSVGIDRAKIGLRGVKSQNYPKVGLSVRFFMNITDLKQQRTVPSLDLNYDFFAFITNHQKKKYYEKLVDIASSNLQYRRSLLLAAVYQEAANASFLRDSLRLLKQERESLEKIQAMLSIQRKYDLVPLSVFLDNEVLLKRCVQAQHKMHSQLEILVDRFSYLIGSGDKVLPEKISYDFDQITVAQVDDLAEDMAQKKLESAELLLKGARIPNLPSLRLETYSVFPVNRELSMNQNFWISLSLNYVFFDAGERKRRIASAEAGLEEASAEYEKFKQEKSAEIKRLTAEVEELRIQLDIDNTEVRSLEMKITESDLEEVPNLFSEKIYSLNVRLFEKKLAGLRNRMALFLVQLERAAKKYSFLLETEKRTS
ncbi:MAG: TolC family protein [Candidatus Aminicenantes bacterium]|nr:TolC family protein [Candidatus Aminicenantes bacterium]